MSRHLSTAAVFHAAVILSLMIISSIPAWSYIDPGTANYLLQMLAAGVLAGLIALRAFWGNIKQALSKLTRRPKE